MKISYKWLHEYYPSNFSPEEVGVFLTGCGLEVEGIEEFDSVTGGLKGLYVGEVKTCVRHPDADKLSLTTVDTGHGESVQIVCGAPNVAAGQKVIVAIPGTKIFPLEGDPFIIKQAKIRGQASHGMICAEDEIGLGKSHEGIIVLPSDAKVGMPAVEYYGLMTDYIFEIGLTPNRADAASHLGVARDLAAVVRTKILIEQDEDVHMPVNLPVLPELKPVLSGTEISVIVEDTIACPRYSGIVLSDVRVAESPAWLKNRLLSIGVNPINNIVDITNFVLHECGQPLHAFDADNIKGKRIVVRTAKENEKFVTLDKIERTLFPGDLLICDENKPMCIAGVYGGLHSGITENTTTVFLESAYFNPASIRKTSKRHGLKTDASFRFERGTDPELTLYALQRAAIMICEIAGGRISSNIIDNYPVPSTPPTIHFSIANLDRFSGQKIDPKVVRTILESLQIKIRSEKDDTLELQVPLFKVDVTRPADIIEEILRIYGYDRIPVPSKINASIPATVVFDKEKFQNKVGDYLSANGFMEIVSNSLTKKEYSSLPGWDEKMLVPILNPLSQELSVMRQDLLVNALEAIQYNVNRKNSDLRLFEFGKNYFKTESGYKENNILSVVMTGKKEDTSWKQKDSEVDFFLLKAYVNNIIEISRIPGTQVSSGESPQFNSSLAIRKGKDILVEYGNIKDVFLNKFDLSQEVYCASFNWDALLRHSLKSPVQFSEISKFPSVKRDLSMQIANDISYSKLEDIAYNTEKKFLKDIRLFDVYSGDKIEAGKKSYAMSFILQDDQQTLNEQQIGKVMDKLMAAFEKEAGAVIRKN